MTGDVMVYLHPNGQDYVGYVNEDWWQWPAVQDGWRSRKGFPRGLPYGNTDWLDELEPRLAHLALRLSGVTP